MADSKTIQINLKAVSDFKDVINNVKQMQQAISGLSLPKNLESQFSKIFTNIEKNISKASNAMDSGFKTKSSVTAYETATNQIAQDWKRIASIIEGIDTKKLNFEINSADAKKVADDIARLKQEINQLKTDNIEKVKEAFKIKPETSTAKAWQTFYDVFVKGEGDLNDAADALARLKAQIEKAEKAGKDFGQGSNWDKYKKAATAYEEVLTTTVKKQADLNEKEKEQIKLQEQANSKGDKYVKELGIDIDNAAKEMDKYNKETQEAATNTNKLGSEIDQFKNRIQYFFGLNNAVRLFQRAVRSAYETIKDLDKVMTETAVVTKFDIGDMWSQLPEYTKRANELGISIHDAYEAATLYYQQGLQTNEVMAVSNETLKMARIAGLDAAEATDRMTNALRGFNMEITEANAQNINDVYSNLAAKTASNVDEISTAMTKVASLANNANMSFENTAAFLSQIIETTRESAETAGTALKTVIARFSEVKNLYNEGELLGELEGEEIDVNKVSKALRTAGINLNEYLTGMKGLDQIFMELSERWDSLDQVQQRYIATMAAGSRQQSRFIALMQDNARMTQLVSEANNAAGASQGQFEKTLESLQSKLAQLKNAWDTFLMGLANDGVIKALIDLLTGAITAVNKLTSSLPGLAKSLANIGVIIGGLNLGKGILNKLLPGLGASFFGKGKEAGTAFNLGLKDSLERNGNIFTKGFWKELFYFSPDVIDTSGIENVTLAIEQETLALEHLNEVKATIAALEANEISFAQASADIATEEAIAEYNAAAAISTKEASLKALNINETEYIALSKMGLTTKEMAVGATMKQILADGSLTEVQKKEAITQAALNKTQQKGLVGLLSNTAMTITNKMAKMGLIPANTRAAISEKLLGDVAVSTGTKLAISLGIIGAIIAAVALLVVGIVALVKAAKDSTPEARLEAAKEAAEAAAEAADKAAEAYDGLGQSIDSLGDKYNKIDEFTEGTREWRDAVQEVNQGILDLINNYPELAAFVQNQGGVLKIDFESEGVKEVFDKYFQESILASSTAIGANLRVARAEIEVAKKDLPMIATTTMMNVRNDEATKQVALALAGDLNTQAKLGVNPNSIEFQTDGKFDQKKYVDALATAAGAHLNEAILTEKGVEELRSYGETLLKVDKQIEAQGTAMSANALQIANINEGMRKYANNFLTSGIGAMASDDFSNYRNFTEEQKKAYEIAFKEALGSAFKGVGSDGSIKISGGGEIAAQDALKAYSSRAGTEAMVMMAEKFAQYLEESGSEALRHLYEKSEGMSLTEADFKALTGQSAAGFLETGTYNENILVEMLKSAGLEEGTAQWDQAVNDYVEKLRLSAQAHVDAGKIITSEAINSRFEASKLSELDASQKKAITENLADVFAQSGEVATLSLMDSIGAVMEESGEYADDFMIALNSLDWSTIDSIGDLSLAIDGMGIPINKDTQAFKQLASQLIKFGTILPRIDLEGLTERLKSANELVAKFQSGKATRTWSDKEYLAMAEGGVSQEILSQFEVGLNGEYHYLGNNMDDLRKAIENATKVEQKRTKETLEGQLGAKNILTESFGSGGYNYNTILSKDGNAQRGFLFNYLTKVSDAGIDLKALGIDQGDRTIQQVVNDISKSGQIEEVLQRIINLVGEDIEGAIKDFDLATVMSNRLRQSISQNASEAATDEYSMRAFKTQLGESGVDLDFFEEYYKRLDSSTEQIRAWNAEILLSIAEIYKEAEALGIDSEKLTEYTEQLQEVYPALRNNKELAFEVAFANTKLNTGLSEIISSYKDWTILLDGKTNLAELANSDDVETFNKLRDSVEKMLNVTGHLSDDFWTDKKAMDALKSAAEGDVEALEYLQKVAAYDYLIHVEPDYEGTDAAITELANFILGYDLPTLEAGATLDDTNFIEVLNEMIKKSGIGADKVNEMLGRIGYKAKVSWDTSTTTQRIPIITKTPRMLKPGEVGGYTDTGGYNEEITVSWKEIKTPIQVPRIESIISTGTGGGGVSHTNVTNGKKNIPKSSKSSGKKSNSSSTPSYWKNPYDELYNLQEKINEALRRREALERKYQKLLKEQTTSIRDIRKGYYDQINALRQEIKLQQQLQAGRKRQIQNLGSQTYTDSKGRQRTFSSMGVTRYAHYDFETGRITIDWEGLEALAHDPSKTEQGEAAEAYINMLQELVSSYEDTRDAIWEIEDTIEDLMHEAIDSYISFEERVMDALISRYEKQIDTLETMNEAIADAAAEVIDSIQEQIAAQRQERQNQKTEESIAEKEARLAYLRRDTSGSNQLEILQLEKEIAEARENYEDSLIDQAIEQMRKDADLAAEQRAKQIEIMRAQLEVAIQDGSLWQEVYDLINSATDESGALDFNSELIRLLKEAEAFAALSAFASDEWISKVGEEFRRAIEGLVAGNADYAGQHQGEGSGSDSGGSDGGSSGGGSTGGSSGGSGGLADIEAPDYYPYMKPSETTGIIKKGSKKKEAVKGIQWALNYLGFTDSNGKELVVDGIFGDKTDYAVTEFQNYMGLNGNGKVGDKTRKKFKSVHFASGGLADFTGPAWLDGSRSNPELVLNPDDTRNFITLKNILSGLLNDRGTGLSQLGTAYFDIDVNAEIGSDYDVDQMVNEIKREIVRSSSYRNVNMTNFVR